MSTRTGGATYDQKTAINRLLAGIFFFRTSRPSHLLFFKTKRRSGDRESAGRSPARSAAWRRTVLRERVRRSDPERRVALSGAWGRPFWGAKHVDRAALATSESSAPNQRSETPEPNVFAQGRAQRKDGCRQHRRDRARRHAHEQVALACAETCARCHMCAVGVAASQHGHVYARLHRERNAERAPAVRPSLGTPHATTACTPWTGGSGVARRTPRINDPLAPPCRRGCSYFQSHKTSGSRLLDGLLDGTREPATRGAGERGHACTTWARRGCGWSCEVVCGWGDAHGHSHGH